MLDDQFLATIQPRSIPDQKIRADRSKNSFANNEGFHAHLVIPPSAKK